MDYMEFIEYCKEEIVSEYPSVSSDDLEQFWSGDLMELKRMMFWNKKGTDMYQVTYDSKKETSAVVKYVVAE